MHEGTAGTGAVTVVVYSSSDLVRAAVKQTLSGRHGAVPCRFVVDTRRDLSRAPPTAGDDLRVTVVHGLRAFNSAAHRLAAGARALVVEEDAQVSSADLARALRRGALGALSLADDLHRLAKAVWLVSQGRPYLSYGLVEVLVRAFGSAPVADHRLSGRESQVLALLCHGLDDQRIGERLGIGSRTVRHHIGSICAKVGVRTRLEVVVWAYQNGLVA